MSEEKIQCCFTGRFKIYEINPVEGEKLGESLEKKANKFSPEEQSGFLDHFVKIKGLALKATIQNQALRTGVSIYEDVGPSSVTRIVAGDISSPTVSTFTTQQSLEQPINGLTFPRNGSYEKSDIINGFRWTFAFRRPAISMGGATITEMGVQVAKGTQLALLNRIVAPSSGLPHLLSTTQDTLCIVEIDKVYL